MIFALLLTLIIGIVWMFVGIIYSNATRDENEFDLFMITNLIFYALIAFGMPFLAEFKAIQEFIPIEYMPVKPLKMIPCGDLIRLSILMFPVAFFSIAGFFLLAAAMRKGSHSVAWGIMQSAIVMPFLTGWLLFGDNVNLISIGGMVLIIISLVFMVKGKQLSGEEENINELAKDHKAFLFWSFAAFLGTGLGQVGTLLPNKITLFCPESTPFNEDVLAWRIPLISLFWLILWCFVLIKDRCHFSLKQLKNGLLYAIVTFVGEALLFVAIDMLSKDNLSGIVYPLAVGFCIVFFSLFCMLIKHERLHYFEKLGLGVLTIGLFVQAIAAIF